MIDTSAAHTARGRGSEALRRTGIVDGPLPAALLSPAPLCREDHGAIASFCGVVRDHHDGRAVQQLHYDCYRPMAERVLAELVDETRERCDPALQAMVLHGIGDMRPGEVSLVIHVSSAHRAAAFDACRHLLERIKADLPVWKCERYEDGSQRWLNGS